MASLLTTTSGADDGTVTISIDHHNDIRRLLNGTTAYLVKLIANDDGALTVDPDSSGFLATRHWLRLRHTDAATLRLGIRYNGVIDSDVATGTAPFEIASTTVVTNLNADLVDGLHVQSGGTGSIVATGGAATLTDKTLTLPTIADFTNAAHDHGDADDGGVLTDGAIALTTAGDIVYSDGTNLARLAIGTANQILRTNAGATAPEWASRAAAIALTTAGDIVYYNGTDLTRLGIGTASQVLRTNAGATAPEWSTTGVVTPVYKTATQTINNSSTLTNITDLAVSVGANQVWVFTCVLIYDAATAADLKAAFTGPAGATMRYGGIGYASTITSTNEGDMSTDTAAASGGAVIFGASSTAETDVVTLHGYIATAGTAGTLQLQAAQNAANASNLNIYIGSFLVAHRIS